MDAGGSRAVVPLLGDGFVVWRTTSMPVDPVGELTRSLDTVFARVA